MRASRRSAVYRVFSAAVIALLLIALLSGNALAAGTDGLTVETLTFRDVLALYAADRDSFGENASETDGDGVTNAAKRLAEMFTFTVGLNYAGEGLNCNYFGKDISAQMGAEPYTDANRLASYDVEILPYRSYAVALPQGQTTTISVYLAGYTNAAASGGVEAVLHYVWQDQGVWYAVKDDNPYYRIRFNGKSARALAADGLAMALAHAENGTAAIGAWENLSAMPDGNGAATLADGTLLAGQGSANLIGVTNDISALSTGSLSHSLLAVSDFLRGDTTYQTGPLVHKRDCFEAGTLHRVPDAALLGEKSVKRLAIAQVYLRAVTSGAGRRIRRARCGDETRYYYTEKTRVTAVTRIEREHEITAAEFEALLSERDEALRTIEKTRYLVPFEGHTLEIDVFPFWRDRAFCECELQSEDEPLPLPDWLHVYREVTDDPRYTNRALARSVPDEIL